MAGSLMSLAGQGLAAAPQAPPVVPPPVAQVQITTPADYMTWPVGSPQIPMQAQAETMYAPPKVAPHAGDPWGLGLAQPNPRPACSLLLYGAVGVGKTFLILSSFNDYVHISFRPNVCHDFDYWVDTHPEEARSLGLHRAYSLVIPKYQADGRTYVNTIEELRQAIWRIIAARRSGNGPMGVIIDELNTLGDRVEEEIRGRDDKGGIAFLNFWKIDSVKDFMFWICDLPSGTGLSICAVGHEELPQYDRNDEERNQKTGEIVKLRSPTFGQLMAPGGPKLPFKTMVGDVSQRFDIIAHMTWGKDPGPFQAINQAPQGLISLSPMGGMDRVLQMHPTPFWEAKCHGSTGSSIRPYEHPDLRSAVYRAGYWVPGMPRAG